MSPQPEIKEERKEEEATPIKKATHPVSAGKIPSKFSIQEALNKKEVQEDVNFIAKEEELPNNHFTEKDVEDEWQHFIEEIKISDIVLYSAISSFKMSKADEDTILVSYPSDTAKAEFEKVQGDFFSHFKRKVNHHRIKVEYKMDVALKKEILTKRKVFEKFVEINPVLNDLNELMKFDFT